MHPTAMIPCQLHLKGHRQERPWPQLQRQMRSRQTRWEGFARPALQLKPLQLMLALLLRSSMPAAARLMSQTQHQLRQQQCRPGRQRQRQQQHRACQQWVALMAVVLLARSLKLLLLLLLLSLLYLLQRLLLMLLLQLLQQLLLLHHLQHLEGPTRNQIYWQQQKQKVRCQIRLLRQQLWRPHLQKQYSRR